MKTFLLAALFIFSASAAEAPALTDNQKLSIREAELALMTLQAERGAIEARLKDLDYALIPRSRNELIQRRAAVTPNGYQLQQDLTLTAIPTKH